MIWRVGMKAVCIRNFILPSLLFQHLTVPVKDAVYTVRGIVRSSADTGLLLEEIVNEPALLQEGFVSESGFACDDFRPLIEQDTDISAFKALLNTAPETVSA